MYHQVKTFCRLNDVKISLKTESLKAVCFFHITVKRARKRQPSTTQLAKVDRFLVNSYYRTALPWNVGTVTSDFIRVFKNICKDQWVLCHGLGLRLTQRCWRCCENWWNCEHRKVQSDFDPPCYII